MRKLTKFDALNDEEGNITIILRGGTGVGKTTIAKLLAQKLKRSVHIEQDILRYMIVNGLVASRTNLQPGTHPKEYQRQCRLADENTYDLIKNFANAGFNTIVDGFNGGESGHTFYFLEQPEDISWYQDEALVKKKLPDITLYQIDLYTKEEILIKRLKEVRATNAKTLVTACPKCQIHLNCAMCGTMPESVGDLKIDIKDITVILAEAMGVKI